MTRVKHELLDVFASMGFDIADGPEIELHEYNFDKLGFPPDHPATDMQDTLLRRRRGTRASLLRTHTLDVQVREMCAASRRWRWSRRARRLPARRRRHALADVHPDRGLHRRRGRQLRAPQGRAHALRERAVRAGTPVRFRPSYFPFVEPGGEVDVGCVFCKRADGTRADCRVCKGTGCIEILGCGMIHPVVFENVGYDPER